MTTTLLITSLSETIRAITANMRLPVEYQNEEERRAETTWSKINVYEQYIPADLFQNEVYFPCVIVELLDLTDNIKDGTTATVGLSVGTFAKEADGWKDCFNLVEVIRRRLLSERVVAKSYRLKGEIVWQPAQNQPAPFFFMYAEAQYELYLPQEPIPLERTLPADLVMVKKDRKLRVEALQRRID